MNIFSDRRRTLVIVGVFLIAALIAGVWIFLGTRSGSGSSTAPPTGTPTVPATTATVSVSPPTVAPTTSMPPAQSMTVKVYFHRGTGTDPGKVVPVDRTVPRTTMVATAALNQLLGGPTGAERGAGYWSHFSAATAGTLLSVQVRNGVGYADFRDYSRIIPNASSSAGSAALLAELDATFRQFPTVRSTVYSFDGDIGAFYEWLQMVPPAPATPADPAAVMAAYRFLTDVVGMTTLVNGPSTWNGADRATVALYKRSPARPGRPAVVVSLRRAGTVWSITAVRTHTIQVQTPTAGQRVASPVRVSGQCLTFEGTVTVRVVRVSAGKATSLGTGVVTGGGDTLRPFRGDIAFTATTAGDGWVLFVEHSPVDGAIDIVTAVPVTFRVGAT